MHEYLWTDYNDNVTNIWHKTIFEKNIYMLWYYLILLHVNANAFAVHATQTTSKAAL